MASWIMSSWKAKYEGTPNIDRIIDPLRWRWSNAGGPETREEVEAKEIEEYQKAKLHTFTAR